jgi:hypothetical protein
VRAGQVAANQSTGRPALIQAMIDAFRTPDLRARILFVLAMLALDLGVFHRKTHVISAKEALTWSLVWITLSLLFNAGLYFFWDDLMPDSSYSNSVAALAFLTGYLIEKYGLEQPLSLSVRLVFEQSYAGIDGDSASAAEVFAAMSAIGNIPLTQGIAVTGSVNQKGEIQAIGGVNEKIEGFFEVCNEKGLTGKQGVLIPEANIKNLMLKDSVVKACKAGKFSVRAIRTIDEGFEVLSGLSAGEKNAEGVYPEGTFNRIICDKLLDYHDKFKSIDNKK